VRDLSGVLASVPNPMPSTVRLDGQIDGVTVSQRPLHTSDRTGQSTESLTPENRERRYFLVDDFFLAADLVPAAAFLAAAGFFAAVAAFAPDPFLFFAAGREAATCAL